MRSFYVIANSNKPEAGEAARFIRNYLEKRGASCFIRNGYASMDDITPDMDCALTLGGDGTLLRAATTIEDAGIPMAGINMGRLGYLTTLSSMDEVPGFLDDLLKDVYTEDKRILLEARKSAGKTSDDRRKALNEVVVGRKMNLRPVRAAISVNGVLLNEYTADGIIISTPTGSTGYNLSAGGPILEASSEMIIITPICPHALTPSSIVISADNEIEVRVTGGDDNGQTAILDGEACFDLSEGDTVVIRRTSRKITLLASSGYSFTDTLRKKLRQL